MISTINPRRASIVPKDHSAAARRIGECRSVGGLFHDFGISIRLVIGELHMKTFCFVSSPRAFTSRQRPALQPAIRQYVKPAAAPCCRAGRHYGSDQWRTPSWDALGG